MNTNSNSFNGDSNSRKVDSMISVMSQLCTLLKKENDILEKNKVRDIEKLVDPKVKLINIYAEQYQNFYAEPGLLNNLDRVRKEEIMKIAKLLQELMEKNERLLNANINSTRRIIDIIVTEAQNYEKEQSGVYSSSGKLGHPGQKCSNMSYNQVL